MIGAFRWDLVLLDGRTPRLAGEVLVQLLEAYAEAPPKIFLVVGGRLDRPRSWRMVQITCSPSGSDGGEGRCEGLVALVRRFAAEHRLSQREMEMIDLAATGLATKEIGARL